MDTQNRLIEPKLTGLVLVAGAKGSAKRKMI
jgi:hypothetical protein